MIYRRVTIFVEDFRGTYKYNYLTKID